MNENQAYGAQPLQEGPIDPERQWARPDAFQGLSAPNRPYQREAEGGIIGNPARSLTSARNYAQGYRLSDNPAAYGVSSRNVNRARESYANMEISPPAQVLNVTKPMG